VKSILFDHFGRSFWSSEREVRALEKQRDKASARPNGTPVVLVSVRSDQRSSVRVSAGGRGGGGGGGGGAAPALSCEGSELRRL
jgi:hypothetical protein